MSLRCRHRTPGKEKKASFYKDGTLIVVDPKQQTPDSAIVTIQLESSRRSYTCKFDEDEGSESVKIKVDRK